MAETTISRTEFVGADDPHRKLIVIERTDGAVHLSLSTATKQVGLRLTPDDRLKVAELLRGDA